MVEICRGSSMGCTEVGGLEHPQQPLAPPLRPRGELFLLFLSCDWKAKRVCHVGSPIPAQAARSRAAAAGHKWLGVIFGRQACNRHARIPRLEEFVSIWLAACGPVGLYISCKTDSNSGGAFWRGKLGLPLINSRCIPRQKSSSPTTHRGKSN